MDLLLDQQLVSNQQVAKSFKRATIASLYYHHLFGYPLKQSELIKWVAGPKTVANINLPASVYVGVRKGYWFLAKGSTSVVKRALRERASKKKLVLARRAARILGRVPTIKMVAITGSLAMRNSDEEGDIDLMIIVRHGTLWLTRLLVYGLLKLINFPLRRPKRKDGRDKLCLNIWLDEKDLAWKEQNVYTAHEIAQVEPLVNKDNTYERFLWENKWVAKYWPSAAPIKQAHHSQFTEDLGLQNINVLMSFIESIAFKLQRLYMKSKITREVVSPTRALFHPIDWGESIMKILNGQNSQES